MKRIILARGIIHFPALAMLAMTAGAATWSNPDSHYPPDETQQNWNLDDNWSTNVVSANEEARISNGGAALINTAVPDITAFLIGNSADSTLTHSLSIADGGSISATAIVLDLNPSVSGANFFAWDLKDSGSESMLEGITVVRGP